MLLEGRRLLITGVLTEGSIAYSVAKRAQEEGAEIVLTGFGRGLRITQRMAKRLGDPGPDVLEMDVNEPDQMAAVAADLEERWGALDGILHAIAFAPGDALGNNFLNTPVESAQIAFATSAYSLKSLSVAMLPLLEKGDSPSIVGLDFDAQVAWPVYDWMGVAKAALESVSRYLARDLGPKGIRSNLVSAGPIGTMAAKSIPGFSELAGVWNTMAPLHWDTADAGPTADAIIFLLSTMSRGITGEIMHVDGGFHAMARRRHRPRPLPKGRTVACPEAGGVSLLVRSECAVRLLSYHTSSGPGTMRLGPGGAPPRKGAGVARERTDSLRRPRPGVRRQPAATRGSGFRDCSNALSLRRGRRSCCARAGWAAVERVVRTALGISPDELAR